MSSSMAEGTLHMWLSEGSWDGEMIVDNADGPSVLTKGASEWKGEAGGSELEKMWQE